MSGGVTHSPLTTHHVAAGYSLLKSMNAANSAMPNRSMVQTAFPCEPELAAALNGFGR